MLLQQLEERIVLDAAVSSTQDNPENQANSHAEAGKALVNDPTAAAAPQAPAADGNAGLVAPVPETFEQVFTQDLNVVLISNALGDIEGITNAAVEGAEVIVYDAMENDLGTITDTLLNLVGESGEKIGHLAIVSHGDPGILYLSEGQAFSALTVQSDPEAWQSLGALLAEDARSLSRNLTSGQNRATDVVAN